MNKFLQYASEKDAQIIASGAHSATIKSIHDGVITGRNEKGYIVDGSVEGIAVVFELTSGQSTYLNRLYLKEVVDVDGQVREFKEVDGFIAKMKEIGVSPDKYVGASLRIVTKGQFVQDMLPLQVSAKVRKW